MISRKHATRILALLLAVLLAVTLALLRQEKEISQRKAAADLGISQALLSHYENGVREPGLAFVKKACDYYHVSADYLPVSYTHLTLPTTSRV